MLLKCTAIINLAKYILVMLLFIKILYCVLYIFYWLVYIFTGKLDLVYIIFVPCRLDSNILAREIQQT